MNKKNIFDENGNLPYSIHRYTMKTFYEDFCSMEGGFDSNRSNGYFILKDIYKWAVENNAVKVIIGGSFVTNKDEPNDLDLIIIFDKASQIPKKPAPFTSDSLQVDIDAISMENEKFLDAYIKLFSTDKFGRRKGIVEIEINSVGELRFGERLTGEELYETVLNSYSSRMVSKLKNKKGLIIPIHGIKTHAEWLPELTLHATLDDWAVAPFVYGYQNSIILFNKNKQRDIVESFRQWIDKIKDNYDGPISIIAHSFGTFIVAKYLESAGVLSCEFESIILCGSIISEKFDWGKHFEMLKVGCVLNTISSSDEYVKFMPYGCLSFLSPNKLMGQAGRIGFSRKHPSLIQEKSEILYHNNVIQKDVIKSIWLPFLNVNRNSIEKRRNVSK